MVGRGREGEGDGEGVEGVEPRLRGRGREGGEKETRAFGGIRIGRSSIKAWTSWILDGLHAGGARGDRAQRGLPSGPFDAEYSTMILRSLYSSLHSARYGTRAFQRLDVPAIGWVDAERGERSEGEGAPRGRSV